MYVVSRPISFAVKLKLISKLESLLTDTPSLSWISFAVKLKSNMEMDAACVYDSLRREVETMGSPFTVKLSQELDIFRREVEIQVSCIVPIPISSTVKLKLALELGNCLLTTSRPFAVNLNLCCLESNILRCEVEIGSETGKPLRREVEPQNGTISSVVELKSWMCGYDILRRGVEIVDGPFVVKLSLDLNILRREVEIQVLYVAGGHDSLRREVGTVDDPFIVKFDFELDILRREVEIYSRANCVILSPIFVAVKLKLTLNEIRKLFVDRQLPIRCEIEKLPSISECALNRVSFVLKLKLDSKSAKIMILTMSQVLSGLSN
ncbi:hypothetical protein F3Y22_tig00113337pilonHSYRG00061 [Hibiscus syriacus]|uniref:Uncharacterized protein n=1 Tax=Hibiscus syriacus TaxID=106335 RepID=A0A6A2X5Q2_HIBSY|nr:hypothetical protein F3Y22_tig00113337pilonHSYRG00061 [Hibiscus syriacus]